MEPELSVPAKTPEWGFDVAAMPALTKRLIDSTPRPAGEVNLFDSGRHGVEGFGVRIVASGVATFFLRYRDRRGKRLRWKIGRYGKEGLTVEQARRIAGDMRHRIEHEGFDPRAAVTAKLDARFVTVEKVVGWYLADADAGKPVSGRGGGVLRQRKARDGKARWSRLDLYRKTLENVVKPKFGDVPIAEMTAREIREFLADKPASVRDAMRALFRYAAAFTDESRPEPVLSANPMSSLRATHRADARNRERVLENHEIRALWVAAGRMEHHFGALVRLLFLTGQRRGEAAELRRRDLDLSENVWTIPAGLTKSGREHKVPLSDAALTVLYGCKPKASNESEPTDAADGAGEDEKDLVFRSRRGGVIRGFTTLRAVLHADAEAVLAELEIDTPIRAWTLHDIRRTVATRLAIGGASDALIGLILNHDTRLTRGVTSVYNRHSYIAERRAVLDQWSRELELIVNPPEKMLCL